MTLDYNIMDDEDMGTDDAVMEPADDEDDDDADMDGDMEDTTGEEGM